MENKSGGNNTFRSNDLNIRAYQPTDSLSTLTDLLHRSYKSLAEMGLKYLATHQPVETTKERIDKGECFLAEIDRTIIGLINYYPPQKKDIEGWIEAAWMGQFAVEPDYQRKGIGSRLIRHVEHFAKEQGDTIIALDTAEPAKHLIQWYERMGYSFHSYINWEVTNYRSVIMVKEL